MSKAQEVLYKVSMKESSNLVSSALLSSYGIQCSELKETNSVAFQKFWNLVIDNAVKISKKSIELTKGVFLDTTGYRISGVTVPKTLRGKGMTDPKKGRMIVVSSDGESAALVQF